MLLFKVKSVFIYIVKFVHECQIYYVVPSISANFSMGHTGRHDQDQNQTDIIDDQSWFDMVNEVKLT